MQLFIISLSLLVLSILEGTILAMPLVLILLICVAAVRKDAAVFFLAFFSGFFLDILLLRTLGVTSIFYITCLFLIMLYQRKFEIASYYFVGFASFFGSLAYALIFVYPLSILQATVSIFLAILFFLLLRRYLHKDERPHLVHSV